jgi:hypothetical protein
MAVMGSLAYSALQRASQQQQISGDAASGRAGLGGSPAGPATAAARMPTNGRPRARRSSCCGP